MTDFLSRLAVAFSLYGDVRNFSLEKSDEIIGGAYSRIFYTKTRLEYSFEFEVDDSKSDILPMRF